MYLSQASPDSSAFMPSAILLRSCRGWTGFLKSICGWGVKIFGQIKIFEGGFLKYLSSQAVTVENPVAVDTEANADRINTNQYQFNGEKKLDNETYQLYLVYKYDIKKNDTLQKYVLNNTPYPDLQEALKVAHNLETGE